MDNIETIAVLAALAQTTRLEAFRLLVEREPSGLPVGEIAQLLSAPQNTVSAHLAILARAKLVTSERHSRSIIYRANIEQLQQSLLYLVKDCCGGRTEVCSPLIKALSSSCKPKAPANV